MHNLLKRAWIPYTDYLVGYYAVLPDHLHLFIRDDIERRRRLYTWVTNWKTYVTGYWLGTGDLWQRSFWDRQMRNAEDYGLKYLYVRNNPVRHGLVSEPEDWPYQGEMNDF
ncbi:MAG: hypothetical protein JO308_12715 [Verrucomicrobia bacterium]|nr:hypothetical protein [Verrucomicrobiota bacterium]